MKVARKNLHAREDCLDVSERGIRVRLTAYRNRIVATIENPIEGDREIDLLTEQLYNLLLAESKRFTGR